MAQAPVITPHAILFVTQVPVPTDFTTIGSTFGNHRGGDLWIRYPDGTLRNLTALAGYGNSLRANSGTGYRLSLLVANASAQRVPVVQAQLAKTKMRLDL
jgi:hypothetical protein